MSTATLIPTANQTSGGATYSGGSANYTNLSDASDSTKLEMTDDAGYLLYPITDVPTDVGEITSVSITLRCHKQSSKSYAVLDFAQIVQSDGTTALTSTVTTTITTTATTYTMTVSAVYNGTSQSLWNGALLKIKQTALSGKAGIQVQEASVVITYTQTGDGISGSPGNWFLFM